jgi:hypothetical protein
MATRMQQRRGTAQQWTDADPILAAGEIGFETDTNQFKIGDGVNAWSDLSYFKNLEDLGGSLDDYILVSTRGQSNGVATLDNTGKIPSSQIPALVGLDSEITAAVSAAVSDLIDGAPAALDTLNEISAVLGDPSNITGNIITQLGQLDDIANGLGTDVSNLESTVAGLQTDVSSVETTVASHGTAITGNTDALANQADDISTLSGSVTDHIADTMGVHGIADTSLLATKSYADDVAGTAQSNAETNAASTADTKISTHNSDTTDVHGIANTANLATKSYADTAVSDHNADTTNVHGISDTSALATKTYADGAVTTAVAALTKSSVGLGNVDNTSDANKPVSTAAQTALDLKANLAGPTFTGTVSGITKSMVGLANVDNTTDANKPVSTATQTALDAKLNLSGGTLTGALTLSGAPTSDLHAATKLYVDGLAAGINFHPAVKAATSTNISTTYANGTNGYGATLTADANGAMGTVDGQAMSVGDRILVKSQTDAKQNGIYVVTSLGGASSKWVITRAADDDNNPNGEMAAGDFCFVTAGTVAGGSGYILSGTGTLAIGTDNITYVQFNTAQAVVAGTNITKSGSTISVADAPTFSGAITASSGVVFSDGTQTKEGVPSRTTIQQKTASYTLSALTERDNLIEVSSSSATTLTIPTNATLALPVGTSIDILQTNTGQVTIAGAAGVTVNGTPGLKLRTQWSSATLLKRATDTWVVMGDLSA